MAIADLSNVLNIFRGSDIDEDAQNALFKEVLLMTLARAADADINIQNVEVDRIREILKEAGVRTWQLQLGNPTGNMEDHRDLVIYPEDIL